MSRATPAEVRAIPLVTSLTDGEIQGWLDVAFTIVESKKSCIGTDEDTLKNVELYLTAHFITMLNPGGGGSLVTSEKTKELATTYATQKEVAESINSTVYGNAANALASGCLSNYDKPRATVDFF